MKLHNLYILALFSLPTILAAQVIPLPNAHAHNDYEHQRPLMEAMENGFTSIEVDIHLIDSVFYVAHDKPLIKKPERTLEKLYLDPLAEIIRKNQGQVYPGYEGYFQLMIDLKTNSPEVYPTLQRVLAAYPANSFSGVTFVLSGNRPIEQALADTSKSFAIDGRPGEIGKGYTASFMPMISDNYKKILKWRGKGPIPDEERLALENLVKQVHAEGKKLRLWATPEKLEVWEVMWQAGVDFLNTDQLEELKTFLLHKADASK